MNQLLIMSLQAMCLNVIAKPEVIDLCKNQLPLIPVKLRTILLNILCKRGFIKDVYILKHLVNPKLIEVDLSECHVNDSILSCFCECKYLQKLDLSLGRRQGRCITAEVLSSLFINLPYLKILAIPHCKEVNDEVIKVISSKCKELSELHIPYSSISDLSLFCIGQNLFKLCVINILGTQISDIGIQYLLHGSLATSLREINIDKCPNISSYATAMVAEKCNNIKIFNCGSFNDNEELVLALNGIKSKVKQVFWNV